MLLLLSHTIQGLLLKSHPPAFPQTIMFSSSVLQKCISTPDLSCNLTLLLIFLHTTFFYHQIVKFLRARNIWFSYIPWQIVNVLNKLYFYYKQWYWSFNQMIIYDSLSGNKLWFFSCNWIIAETLWGLTLLFPNFNAVVCIDTQRYF